MLDDACAFAARLPSPCGGPVEVRPVGPGQSLPLCVRHYVGPWPLASAPADLDAHRAMHHEPGPPVAAVSLATVVARHSEHLELLEQQVARQERVINALLERLVDER